MMAMYSLFVFCVFISCIFASTDFFIDGVYHSTSNSPSVRLHDTGFEVTGRVVLGNPYHACSKLHNVEEVSGNILYVQKRNSAFQCRLTEILQHAQDANASAIIYENHVYGGGFGFLAYYAHWEIARKDWNIHMVEIANNEDIAKELKRNTSVVTANLTEGTDHVREIRDPLIAFSVIFGIWAICLITMAAYKWRLFIQASKLRSSISQICLCLEIIASTLRLLQVIDPPYTRGIYPGAVTAAWDLFIWPLVLTSTLLMTFYWEEAMRSASVHSYPTLHKMKIPFGICVFILMLMAFLTVVFRGLNVDLRRGVVVNGIIILCFTIPIAIFYCVAAYQVLSRLYKTASLSRREVSLYKMTAFLAGVAASMIGGIIFLILLATLPLSKTWFVVSRFGLSLFGDLTSTFQILAFQNPKLASSTSNNSSRGQPMSKNPSHIAMPTIEQMEAAYSRTEEISRTEEMDAVTAERTTDSVA